jgi:hypothetical protein
VDGGWRLTPTLAAQQRVAGAAAGVGRSPVPAAAAALRGPALLGRRPGAWPLCPSWAWWSWWARTVRTTWEGAPYVLYGAWVADFGAFLDPQILCGSFRSLYRDVWNLAEPITPGRSALMWPPPQEARRSVAIASVLAPAGTRSATTLGGGNCRLAWPRWTARPGSPLPLPVVGPPMSSRARPAYGLAAYGPANSRAPPSAGQLECSRSTTRHPAELLAAIVSSSVPPPPPPRPRQPPPTPGRSRLPWGSPLRARETARLLVRPKL